MARTARAIAAAALVASILLLTGCRPILVSRQTTRIYADGSLDRIVEISGRPDDPDETVDDDWLADKVGVSLADERAWARVEAGAGWLRAEGFFASAASLPPTWNYRTDAGPRPAGSRTELEIRDRLLFRLWDYREVHVDPFGPEEIDRALDALARMTAELFRDELDLRFRGEIDPAPAERWIEREGRGLASALLSVSRRLPGFQNEARRRAGWSDVLTRAGIQPGASAEPDAFWDAQIPLLLAESRVRLARALSTETRTVQPRELDFIPLDEDGFAGVEEMIARHRDPESFTKEIEGHLITLSGYYRDQSSPEFRFVLRVEMPGTLISTSGTPLDDRRVIDLFRAEDLGFGERTLRAASMQLDESVLRRLGARRDLTAEARLQLVDLLDRRPASDALVETLHEAVRLGSLKILRDGDSLPDELEDLAAELADLLDPETTLPQPLD